METNDLTKPERLLIDRRRAKLTQKAAAKQWSVSLYIYRRWEIDIGDVPDVVLEDLEVYEEYYIRRRREGVSLEEFAKRLSLSRWWIIRAEKGDAVLTRLTDYWESEAG